MLGVSCSTLSSYIHMVIIKDSPKEQQRAEAKRFYNKMRRKPLICEKIAKRLRDTNSDDMQGYHPLFS